MTHKMLIVNRLFSAVLMIVCLFTFGIGDTVLAVSNGGLIVGEPMAHRSARIERRITTKLNAAKLVEIEKEGQINLVNAETKNTVFKLSAPIMYDATGATSSAIDVASRQYGLFFSEGNKDFSAYQGTKLVVLHQNTYDLSKYQIEFPLINEKYSP